MHQSPAPDKTPVLDFVVLTPPPRAVHRPGKVRPAILLWALGVPIPLILLILLIRGCVT